MKIPQYFFNGACCSSLLVVGHECNTRWGIMRQRVRKIEGGKKRESYMEMERQQPSQSQASSFITSFIYTECSVY